MNRETLGSALAGIMLAAPAVTMANSSAAGGRSIFSAEELVQFSKQVERAAAAKGARVFLVGRMGRPAEELPEGIHYTHTGFGVYSLIETDEGKQIPGYTLYNVYQRDDDPGRSHLVTDFPVDFFAAAQELKAGIVIPTPELQQRLLATIQSDVYRQLHVPEYSAVANPFNLEYQNCTEHTLDVLNAAIYQTNDVHQLKANALAYFEPQEVKVSGWKLAFGAMFMVDVTLADHEGPVVTATFSTVADYLEQNNLVQDRFEVMMEGSPVH